MQPPMAETVTDLTKGVYRRLYSGYLTGQRINRLSLPAEAWFWRVLVASDHRGFVPSDIQTLYAKTAGTRSVHIRQVARWVREMITHGLLAVDGEYYLIVDFQKTQSKTLLSGNRQAIPETVRRDVLSVGCCRECGSTENLTVDHIRPVSKGGSDNRANLQCLCFACNIKKSNKWEEAAA